MLELFRSRRRAIVWFAEASLLVLLVVFASGVMAGWARNVEIADFLRAGAIALVAQASLYYHGLYGPAPIREIRAIVWKTLRALAVAVFLL